MTEELKHIKEYHSTHNAFAKAMNIKILDIDKGYAKTIMELKSQHKNSMGITHGGAIFAIVDTTLGAAATAYGTFAVTAAANISLSEEVFVVALEVVTRLIKIDGFVVFVIHGLGVARAEHHVQSRARILGHENRRYRHNDEKQCEHAGKHAPQHDRKSVGLGFRFVFAHNYLKNR